MVKNFIAIDVETANADFASICAIGLVHFKEDRVFKALTILIDPEDEFDPLNIGIHGIRPEDVAGKPTMAEAFPVISAALEDVVVIHHSHFDKSAMARAAQKYGAGQLPCIWLDTLRVARRAWPQLNDGRGYGLARLASEFNIDFGHHDPADDARAAGLLMLRAIADTGHSLIAWLDRVELTISGEIPGKHARPGDPSGPLAGETVCFTGSLCIPRSEAAGAAAAAGCDVSDGVNKRVTILVVGDQDLKRTNGHEKSAKHRKAEGMIADGAMLKIVGETDFMTMVGASPPEDDEIAPASPDIEQIPYYALNPESNRIHHLVETVKSLKRTGNYQGALTLLFEEIEKQEREAAQWGGVAPWYYEHAAIIFRKLGDRDAEIDVLERFAAQRHSPGASPPLLLARLAKAKSDRSAANTEK